jgi:uncharacterized membrane protein YfcA
MDIHTWQIVAVFFLSLGAGSFSGMAGGGGGFITLPILIALGLSPQQAVATNKMASFGLNAGSVAAFRSKAFANPKLLSFFMVLAVLISLTVPYIFKSLSGKHFQLILGAVILAMIPLIMSEKEGLQQHAVSRAKKIIGAFLMGLVLFLQGVFSGGMGSLNTVLLIYFFGLSALQASAMRRVITLSLNIFIVLALILTTHFIVYKLAFAGMAGGLIGGYTGARLAILRGEKFAKYALAVFMIVSGIWLVLTA